ncbi:hypothetical protein [Paramicrobacterium fandaimingii]|uniref:hypothetical protein n=1 Tax=Paramicrobacterium fandaimingii TaxID=2708079 RepID=UPI001FD28E04|nr:hypothetical protein [Microbacterium fandaimingii]
MTEPQVWTLIGVFAVALFGMLTLMSTMFIRILRAEISGLRREMLGEISGLRYEMLGEISGLRGEMTGLRGEMETGFAAVRADIRRLDARVDSLDSDVQALTKRSYGIE